MDYTIADKYVGKTFKNCRESIGMSIEETAKKLGLPKGTYYYYELGKRSMPFNVYKKACKLFDLDYVVLFEEAQKSLINSIKKR